MVVGPDQRVYVGGDIGSPANSVSYWSGFAWVTLADTVAGNIEALAWGRDGRLYLGGGAAFEQAYVYQGTQWQVLGGGLDSEVSAILVRDDGQLLFGGTFSYVATSPIGAGLIYVPNLALWNGFSWQNALGALGRRC